ncbi:hypothetical protein AB0M80_21540 [Amycolatopsis sp. NPDC051045]|uniref:hypothetical protein n=1 Tax=Amycolatopsis sp. NPDC051045 TaxID=3156922 RepID=UPI00344A2F4D
MRNPRRLPRWALPLTLLLALAGCHEPADAGAAPAVGSPAPATSSAGKSGCDHVGGQMRHWLPKFDPGRPHEASITPVAANPCLPFADLIDQVATLVPEVGEGKTTAAKKVTRQFVTAVRDLAGRYAGLANEIRCLYEADRLAIGIYRHADHPSSVGVVIAVGRDLGTAVDVGRCYLFGLSGKSLGSASQPFENHACAGSVLPLDRPVVVMRFGTSNWMCDALARAVPRA